MYKKYKYLNFVHGVVMSIGDVREVGDGGSGGLHMNAVPSGEKPFDNPRTNAQRSENEESARQVVEYVVSHYSNYSQDAILVICFDRKKNTVTIENERLSIMNRKSFGFGSTLLETLSSLRPELTVRLV